MADIRFVLLPETLLRCISEFLPISKACKSVDLEMILSSPFPFQKLELHLSLELSSYEKERIKYLLTTQSENLRVLKLSTTSELDSDLLLICSGIRHVDCFELACVRLRLEDLLTLLELVKNSRVKIQHVTILRSDLDKEEKQVFGRVMREALLSNDCIHSLRINWGSFDDDCISFLAETLAANDTLEYLQLSYNGLTSRGARELCKALVKNHKLKVLDLSYNDIDDRVSEDLYLLLNGNGVLYNLSLQNNKLGIITARRLSDALIGNQTLLALNLGYNNIGDEVGVIFAAVISINRHLQILNLNGNKIRLRGGTALGEGIKNNKGLRQLLLRLNSIHGEGKSALSTAKSLHRYLRGFDILRVQL